MTVVYAYDIMNIELRKTTQINKRKVNDMRELITKGTKGALLKVCDTPTKYELVSCWNFDEETMSWGQGHYFTLWGNQITEENKKELLEKAKKHFTENYL